MRMETDSLYVLVGSLKKLRGETVPYILMLGKDGPELAKSLKHHQQTRHIPILMNSAHPHAEKGIQDVGDADFLARPFDMDDLLVRVASYL